MVSENRMETEKPTHAEVRVFKLMEVAYNCARNGYYQRAALLAQQVFEHYSELADDGEVQSSMQVPSPSDRETGSTSDRMQVTTDE